MIFALDSNIVIYAMKGMGKVAATLAGKSPDDIAIPSIVVYELQYGVLRTGDPTRRKRDLERLIGVVKILPFDDHAAERAARLRYDLEKSGNPIGPMDLLIAGTALASGARLVTHNTREFARVPGLQIEDWY